MKSKGANAEDAGEEDATTDATGKKRPRRLYGSITLDPDKAGLQVAKVAKEILLRRQAKGHRDLPSNFNCGSGGNFAVAAPLGMPFRSPE